MRCLVFLSIFSTLLVFSQCHEKKTSRNNIGIGVMDYTRNGIPDKMQFYDNPEGRMKHMVLFRDTQSVNYFLKQDWFDPRKSNVIDEYGDLTVLNYTCLECKKPWYKIIVNEETQTSYWIMDTGATIYMDWPSFIKSVPLIYTLDTNMPVYVRPDTNSPRTTLVPPIKDRSVMDIQNEWMKVAYFAGDTAPEKLFSGERVTLGWIRWKDTDKLLIDYDEIP